MHQSITAATRILVLLQRKTLIETENRTLKSLNSTIWLCELTKDPPPPPPGGILLLKSPHPREFAIQGKKNTNAQGAACGRGEFGSD